MVSESELVVDRLLEIVSKVNKLIENCDKLPKEEFKIQARSQLIESRKFIKENLSLIPSHTLKTGNESLQKLESLVDKPDKKELQFKFKSNPGTPKSQPKPPVDIKEHKIDAAYHGESSFGFRGIKGQDLCLDNVDGRDVGLTDLVDCKVQILGLSNTVHLKNLIDCFVVIFLASRAITVDNCTNCKFEFVCQQLRISNTIGAQFKLYTSARSMLEESTELSFSRLDLDNVASDKLKPDQINKLMNCAKFDQDHNNWRSIDDFDWLNTRVPSQNYVIHE